MKKGDFKPGTKVEDTSCGRIGVVLPDPFRLCGKDDVLVEFDGALAEVAINWRNLKILGLIEPEVNHERCKDCIFYNGSCLRYTAGRIAMLLCATNSKKVPNRIYPLCRSP